jgi:hypothetical protein
MSKTDTVKVTIQISERVTYQCTKEMPRAAFERLDKLLDDDDWKKVEEAKHDVLGYINKNNDFSDSTDIEVDEFNLSREQTPVLIMQLSHQ